MNKVTLGNEYLSNVERLEKDFEPILNNYNFHTNEVFNSNSPRDCLPSKIVNQQEPSHQIPVYPMDQTSPPALIQDLSYEQEDGLEELEESEISERREASRKAEYLKLCNMDRERYSINEQLPDTHYSMQNLVNYTERRAEDEEQEDLRFRSLYPLDNRKFLSSPEAGYNQYNQGIESGLVQQSGNFLQRIEHFELKRKLKLNQKKTELNKVEVKECSFKPKIMGNRGYESAAVKRREGMESEIIGDRLYNIHEEHIAKNKLKLLEEKERQKGKEIKDCTFHPDTSKTCEMNRNIPGRSYLITSQICENRSFMKPICKGALDQEHNYTFQPKTNKPLKEMKKAKKYIKQNIFERLSGTGLETDDKQRVLKKFQGVEDEQILSSRTPRGVIPSSYTPKEHLHENLGFRENLTIYPTNPEETSDFDTMRTKDFPSEYRDRERDPKRGKISKFIDTYKFQMNEEGENFAHAPDFFERQMLYELYKQQRKDKLMDEEARDQGKPIINSNSEKIAENLVGFDKRNEVLLNRKENLLVSNDKLDSDEYTFQPRILDSAKTLKVKGADEMCYGPVIHKEQKIQQMKSYLGAKEDRNLTFKPKLITKNNKQLEKVKSRLQIKENLSTYIERMNLLKQRRETATLISQKQREIEDLEECTHHPKIIDSTPKYENSKYVKSNLPLRNSYQSLNL